MRVVEQPEPIPAATTTPTGVQDRQEMSFGEGVCSAAMGLEIRHLRAFLSVAEASSVSRAARELRVAQPALSRTLAQLERHLGSELMVRSPEGITLTEAGKAFHGKAVEAVEAFDTALDLPASQLRPLRVGHAWAGISQFTTTLLRTWRESHPEVQLELRRIDDPYAGLTSRRADVAVLRDRTPPDAAFDVVPLYREARVVAVPSDDRLAHEAHVRLADLVEHALILNTTSGTTSLDLWPTDAAPRAVIEVGTTDDWYSAIASGQGIGITPASSETIYPSREIRYIPLLDAPPVQVFLGWPRVNPHPSVPRLLALARSIVARSTDT